MVPFTDATTTAGPTPSVLTGDLTSTAGRRRIAARPTTFAERSPRQRAGTLLQDVALLALIVVALPFAIILVGMPFALLLWVIRSLVTGL